MSRDQRYQKLLNSRQWQDTKRLVWQRAKGLCERCKREGIAAGIPEGYITPGRDCHHKIPVETGKTEAEMERLCFDWEHNIELLCIPCHIKTHKEMGQNTKENRKQRREDRFERWKEHLNNTNNEQ